VKIFDYVIIELTVVSWWCSVWKKNRKIVYCR